MNGAPFERVALASPEASEALAQVHPDAQGILRDSYLVEFLELPDSHSESDLQRTLVYKLREFLLAPGREFTFVGEQHLLQVGNRDFRVDLLFYHRELQCLVASDSKVAEFQPTDPGQLSIYLEAPV